MSKQFTDASIRALKLTSKPGDRYEKFEPSGLGIRVGNKSKAFVFLYRYNRKPRRMTLGRYPEMALVGARLALAEAKKRLEKGEDPGAKAIEQRRAERDAETINELADLYMRLHARPKKKTWAVDQRMLDCDVLPTLGRMKAKDVTRRDVVALLDKITERAPIAANRVHSLIARMFTFGVSRDIIAAPPTLAIERNKETPRDRVLSDDETKAFWIGLDSAPMAPATRLALKLMLTTGTRKGEVVAAERAEVDNGVWEIPKQKSKNNRAHRVPLSSLALALVEEAKALAEDSPWLFPSPQSPDKPLTANSVDHAMRRSRKALRLENLTPHDLRRTCATNLGALGIDRFIIARVLNHAERDVTGQVYDKYTYEPQVRAALEKWAQRLREIVSGEPAAGKVVELAAHRE